MCGIFGYVGHKPCAKLLYEGLCRLEYRGYDSAGIATLSSGALKVEKVVGRVSGLKPLIDGLKGTVGIAHTRWATHGAPSVTNAHPHLDEHGAVAIAHNGIIENHEVLKELLRKKGHVFVSQTDSEVLAHLIEEECARHDGLLLAVRHALGRVEGAFGLVVLHRQHPGMLIAARRGSPLVIGIADGARLVASDPSALVEHTREVVYLKDDEVALLTADNHEIFSLHDGSSANGQVCSIDWAVEQLSKGGFAHFMLKEIFEQQSSLRNARSGRLKMLQERGALDSLNLPKEKSVAARRVIIIACGTSWHAGLVAKHYIERLSGLVVEVAYASELRYSDPIISSEDLVIAISQSGETADTLEALKLCRSKGAHALGVVNVVGSTIAREVDGGLYLHAGPEIGVASTKAFTTQLVALLFIALHLGLERGVIKRPFIAQVQAAFDELLACVDEVLKTYKQIRSFAPAFKDSSNALYLGRGMHFPVALEGALKLKEISYIHAEGLPAAEMKHGPIALIDKDMPVVVLAPKDHLYQKIFSNVQEVKARGGRLVIFSTVDDPHLRELAEHFVLIPSVHDLLQPIISVIPLQLLAYELAVLRGYEPDYPRNLAKAVSVE